jgi:plasmid stabilization system protein ParE
VTDRFTVRWAQVAVEDLLSIIGYVVDRDGVDAAERLHGRITEAAQKLGTMPRRCRVVPELGAEGITGYRELLVGPYRLMFAIRDGDVVVLTAVDGRRDLGELLIERALRGGV